MSHFDVFNGDADGVCSLHQLRLANPRESTLITGVKRDISLLERVPVESAKSVTVLDISMEKNIDALKRLLDAGVPVSYFDHHHPGDVPDSDLLRNRVDTDANVCTGLIVNRFLEGAHRAWAVTAAFGDNLDQAAVNAAAPLSLGEDALQKLKTLGILMNYNGYGSSLADLYFEPAALYERIKPYADPFDFIENDDAYQTLADGYADDMRRAGEVKAVREEEHIAVYVFPDEPYARRVSGVFANHLAQEHPERAHALMSHRPGDTYLVSVRAPLWNKTGADDLCRQFESGGGRKAAAGINALPASDMERFCELFSAHYAEQA